MLENQARKSSEVQQSHKIDSASSRVTPISQNINSKNERMMTAHQVLKASFLILEQRMH